MTRLRRALNDLAEEAPSADLSGMVDRILTGNRRRRHTTAVLAAVATVVTVVATGTVMATVTRSRSPEVAASLRAGAIADLPGGNVGPLEYAYETPCKVDKRKALDCSSAEWRVVTRAGTTYRLPQALAMTAQNHRVPVSISRDGRMLAYYSRKARAHVVRDLVGGSETTSPVTVKESQIGAGSMLVLSDDGRHVVFDPREGTKKPGLLIDVRTGTTVRVPGQYEAVSVRGGVAELVRYLRTDLRLMPVTGGGRTVHFDGTFTGFSEISPDGRTVAAFERRDAKKWVQELRTLTLLDVGTGRRVREVPIGGLPEGEPVMATGPWLSGSELTVVVQDSKRTYVYGVDIGAGKTRRLADHPNAPYLTLPGIASN
ncbi:hypothetical protein [Streptosporangium sp. NPDC020145]|uniref:hypothetical protein n=1 Tax=Streptosporangium sp. NPDC020145 TaxID=3154694 RepID=UPI003435D4E8